MSDKLKWKFIFANGRLTAEPCLLPINENTEHVVENILVQTYGKNVIVKGTIDESENHQVKSIEAVANADLMTEIKVLNARTLGKNCAFCNDEFDPKGTDNITCSEECSAWFWEDHRQGAAPG